MILRAIPADLQGWRRAVQERRETMIRANNPKIDAGALNEKLRDAAAELRAGGIVEARRAERLADDASPAASRARRRAIGALLDRAEDLNQTQAPLPKMARLPVLGERPARFLLRVVNHLSRQQREINAAQTRALREILAELERLRAERP